ncbi:DUF6801 domain-containing protein [Streptomyces sp. OR43]|uniref:DUF6801 domain-containing protein n=1 Tax=Streptomyces sp. or43 TaxID=2478957 RepID=UPI0011CED1FB|nr:DUF6801 domain-containing protein [Streptomyces sp. or43]TXS43500.1 hypothetical protein EAO72_10065 [Streptomyces sp. or43]
MPLLAPGVRRRTTARGAVVATAVLLGGMLPGAQATAGDHEIDAHLVYTCDFASGKQQVQVGVTATVPDSAKAGERITPTDVVTEVTLPDAVVRELAGAGAVTLSAETRLTTRVGQQGHRTETEWLGTTGTAVPVPASGPLTLSSAGEVPFVRPLAAGDLTFDALGLVGVLTPRKADGTAVEPAATAAGGTAVEPAATPLACTPGADQPTGLGKVRITGGETEITPEPTWPGDTGSGKAEARPKDLAAPEAGARKEPSAAAEAAPPCVGDPNDGLNMVAYVTGYADVTKLRSATKFPLACAQITQGETRPDFSEPGFLHMYQDSAVVLDYQGKAQLPPASGTFLTFGFMPTTAVMEMTQIPPKAGPDGILVPNIKSDIAINLSDNSSKNITVITMDFMLRLRDVEVNGVPMDVGNSCRTSKPFRLTLEGRMTMTPEGVIDGYTLVSGGVLTGSVTIPSFSGCGTAGEDLDSLFTASISGESGYVKQTQGAPCATVSADPVYCTPEGQPVSVPVAER